MSIKMTSFAAAAVLAGALAAGMSAPAQARYGHNTAAAVGFGAGALVGAAAANAANNGYYGQAYAYAPGPRAYGANGYYAAEPGYGAYAYAPRDYNYGAGSSCVTEGRYGMPVDYSLCGGS
jgi:hypothetical protein